MRILVVEDETALRESLKARLVEAGFTVDVAADGEEGLFAGARVSRSTWRSWTWACPSCPGWN